MRAQPLSLIGGAYADDTLSWAAQDTVNWIPAQAEQEGTRTPTMLKTPPGLRPFVQAGTGVVRGTHNCEGRFFAVIGTTLYRISNTGVAIPLGTIPGVGRVIMAHNQITAGNQLLVVNGSSGYVFNTVTEVFERITDTGYPGAINAAFIDGYLIQIEPARRFAFHSDLADAMEYNTLDRFTSEVSPDLLVSMAVSNNELILFSETTTEFFQNTGATQQPFRSKRISMQRGCAGRYAVAQMDNTVMWLGDDGKFYVLSEYSPKRISTRAIEQAIRDLNWSQAFAMVWEDSGHSVCYWTFPDGQTWGFDASTGQWHRRQSYGLNRWRANTMTFWRQQWYAGDFQTGRLWQMDWDYLLEGDTEIISERVSQVLHDNQSLMLVPRVELLFGMGQPETVPGVFPPQPEGPEISGALPDGAVGISWAGGSFTASGGTPPYSFSSRPGTHFPGNLGPMSSTGIVSSKIPTENGVGIVKARVTDANGLWSELTDEFVIASPTIALVGAGPTVGTVLAPTGTDFSAAKNTSIIDGARWLAAGPDRMFAWTTSSIEYSTDFGVSWTPSTVTMSNGGLDGIYWNAFYIVGNTSGGLVYSTDSCATFTTVPTPTAPNTGVIFGSDTLLLVASGSSAFFHKAEHPAGPWTQGGAHTLFLGVHGCMASNGTEFRAGSQATNLGPPKIVRTQDGSAVNPMTLPAFSAALRITCMKWASPEGDGGGVWVAGTDSGEIIYDDGSGWQLSPDTMDGFCNDVNYNGAFFIMCATNVSTNLGTFKRSEDGVTWVTCTGTQTTATALAVLTDD